MTGRRYAPNRALPRGIGWVLLVSIVLYGTALRGWRLGDVALWSDEAETSINALTILSEGVPTNRYLGQPIYENTLLEPWPGQPEYEFRDSSYSKRGLAIYHGWLPLYATALGFRLWGIEPDRTDDPPRVPRGLEELQRRTAAARVQAVAFGTVFLVAIFFAAREAYGTDAGWAALAAAAVNSSTVDLARQARYYSATLAITALCAFALARMVARGRRRDYALGGVTLGLLFHTNLMALLGVAIAVACCAPLLLRQERIVAKLCWLVGIPAAAVVPWVIATGFLDAAVGLPAARQLLGLEDVAAYLGHRWPFVAVAVATVGLLAAVSLARHRLPERLARPFLHSRPILIVILAWTAGTFVAFHLLVPAASYFHSRLSLILLVQALLFGATLFAAVARAITHHHSPLLASALFLLLLGLTGKTTTWWPPFDPDPPPLFDVVEHLQTLPRTPGMRIYADAGGDLRLTFYTGLRVQNVMPVRRTFFDEHPGDIVIIEGPATSMLTANEVRGGLAAQGVTVREEEWAIARRVQAYTVRDGLRQRGATVCGELPPEPAWAEAMKRLQDAKTHRLVAESVAEGGSPMFTGFPFDTFTEQWQVFFYRFVDPPSRMGEELNYAGRMSRGATATLLRDGWAVIRLRPGGRAWRETC